MSYSPWGHRQLDTTEPLSTAQRSTELPYRYPKKIRILLGLKKKKKGNLVIWMNLEDIMVNEITKDRER